MKGQLVELVDFFGCGTVFAYYNSAEGGVFGADAGDEGFGNAEGASANLLYICH